MDMGNDRTCRSSDPPSGRDDAESLAPEWHGLHARLCASRAARRALAGDAPMGRVMQLGSFDPSSARALADYAQVLADINPIFSAYGKPAGNMDAPVASETSSGDRGQE
jgi:hypothetical protein